MYFVMKLWLAFKLFIFTEKSHIGTWRIYIFDSCDWLSNCLFLQRSHTVASFSISLAVLWLAFKLFIFTEKSHTKACLPVFIPVVIGFQIVYFYREVTQDIINEYKEGMLWLAFKLFIFTEKSHITQKFINQCICCDWLSNCLFLQRSHTLKMRKQMF